MSDFQRAYAAVKSDLGVLATPLMELGEQLVRKQGAFLPFGASLNTDGEVVLRAASDGADLTTPAELLPLLSEGLAVAAHNGDLRAVACAEWVTIRGDTGPATDAIKVSVHHADGIAVAFYVPAAKKLLRGWTFGETIVKRGDAIVPDWATGPTT